MRNTIRLASTATAVAALATVLFPVQLRAQTIPGCSADAAPVNAAELSPEMLRDIPLADVPAMVQAGRLCVAANGTLIATDAGGGVAGGVPAPATPPAETPAAPEPAPQPAPEVPAAPTGGLPQTAEEEAPAAPEVTGGLPEPEAPAETAVEPAATADAPEVPDERGMEPEVTGGVPEVPDERRMEPETADTPEVPDETPMEPETAADTPEVPDERRMEPETADTPEVPDERRMEPETAETPEVPNEAPMTPEAEGRPVTVAAGDEITGGPTETTETVVTEADTRSSDEDFAETPDRSSGGLSNFEKFALGAAGLVVLDQLIGQNAEVVRNTGDRVVVRRDNGDLDILKDDNVLLRRPGSEVQTETFQDGSTRTTVTRPNGVQVVTIAAADGRVLRRVKVLPDGRRVVLFDDTRGADPVDISRLPRPMPEQPTYRADDEAALRAALMAERRSDLDRQFTLAQVRGIEQVRELMPEINIDAINFASGSAAIRPEEAEDLLTLGQAMANAIDRNPGEIFLVEGHTDAVGDPAYNLALSDRRAESVALALTEYFDVPPENLVVQGYGERHLLVPTQEAERANRRAVVRRITPLLNVASAY